jgi:streptomycin 6-kinase
MNVHQRLQERARDWRVAVEQVVETDTSLIGFGSRDGQGVVLKVLKWPGDEWSSGEVLRRFDGCATVRVYECADGAMLLERMAPGSSLTDVVLNGRDDEATDVLADVIHTIGERTPLANSPTVVEWANAFDRYRRSNDRQVPPALLEEGAHRYVALASSQRRRRLLHGDLHHYNVLFDAARGWLALDPKGVVGEIEYEIGAMLRNPAERPDLFASPRVVERRIERVARRLHIDVGRTLEWGFAQAVLAAIWSVEDGFCVDSRNPAIQLAYAIRPMLSPGL